MNLTRCLTFLLCSFSVFALVDYTEEVPFPSTKSVKAISKPRPQKINRELKSSRGPLFRLSPFYESLEVKSNEAGKVDITGIEFDIYTPYNIFLKTKYVQAGSSNTELARSGSMQKGNGEFALGFKWFQVGNNSDAAKFDIIAGFRLSEDDSDFATSRSDQMIGLETTKTIQNFLIGLGVHYTLTGDPDNLNELAIGNVTSYHMALGWVVSRDIKFSVDGQIYNIAAQNNEELSYRLAEDLSFSSISPKLHLTLGSMVQLVLGATFRTDRLNTNTGIDYTDARLYMFDGAYGNSMFSHLSISI